MSNHSASVLPVAARQISVASPLGQILLQRGLIDGSILEESLFIQRRTQARLGTILIGQGNITMLSLHQAIAEHYAVPFINLHEEPADPALQCSEDVSAYILHQAVPHQKQTDGTVIIATSDPTHALHDWADARYDGKFAFVITSPLDIYWHIDTHFADKLDDHSRHCLWREMPEKSARVVLQRGQKWAGLALLGALACASWQKPHLTMAIGLFTINLFYLFTSLFKCILFFLGRNHHPGTVIPLHALKHMKEGDLPIYTLLIPLHDEAETLPRLITSLDALDYPKSKLDIKLIVERDDWKTITAIKALKPHHGYELIYVPYSLPQTKPKACNYALHFARGEYVTIYDAEDMPDPLQLKKAVYMFRKHSNRVICLQARLNYYNRNHSLLTQLFAIEYALWFDFMLPALRRLGIPIPLGGTSNHLNLRRLKELGEWDPFNVTEDADLGIRLALSHYETDMLDSLTLEEAPIHLKSWINQRTRWVRGYMQTWLVHMRDPLELARRVNFTAFWGFQLFIGGPCLVFLSTPVVWAISVAWTLGIFSLESALAPWIGGLSALNMVLWLLSHLACAAFAVKRNRWKHMRGALCAFPFYWLLHSAASFKALWQLMRNPHIWEKTPHGLSQMDAHSCIFPVDRSAEKM